MSRGILVNAMLITKIAKQTTRDRYNVFGDRKFVTALAADVLAEAGWREGDTIDEAEVDRFARRDEYGKALHTAYGYLARRPHGEAELRQKLDRKQYDPELTTQVIDHLRELDYVDDETFARQWVMERGSARGPRLLRAELRKKQLSDDVIDRVLSADRDTRDPVLEAKALASKRMERLRTDPKAREKVTAYLARRGYDFDLIRQVIAELAE